MRFQQACPRTRREDVRQSAQRGCRQPAPARPAARCLAAARRVLLRAGRSQRRAFCRRSRSNARSSTCCCELGLRTCPEADLVEGVQGLPRLLPPHRRAARHAAVRHRRRRLQGQRARLAARARLRVARAALGGRPQVPRAGGDHVVRGVEFQVGRTGELTPVASWSRCSSAESRSATRRCTTWTSCERKDVRIGDTVIVRRAGDVIPEVVSRPAERRPADARVVHACRGTARSAARTSKAGRARRSRAASAACFARAAQGGDPPFRVAARNEHRGPGHKLVDQLVDKDMVRTPADVYSADGRTTRRPRASGREIGAESGRRYREEQGARRTQGSSTGSVSPTSAKPRR